MGQVEQERRIKELEERVRALERRVAEAGAFPHPTRAFDPYDWPTAASPPPAPAAVRYPAPLAPEPPAPGPPPSFRLPERRPVDLQKVLGARGLAWAGVLVLALGVVFFLKLAYDRGWVPIPGRFAIGVLGGLALFVTGDLLRTRRVDFAFAQILAGGGAVISYVTVYVAWVLPDYRAALHLTLPLEVTLLAALALLLGAYAVWRNLPVLAGVAVGLSAALVAPAGMFSEVGLLYVAFLDVALLLAAAWRGWGLVVLSSSLAANGAHLAAVVNGVDWRLVAASSAVVNVLAQVAAHRIRAETPNATSIRLTVAGVAPFLLFVTLGLAFGQGGIEDPFGWAALAVGAAALGGTLLSRRLSQGLGAAGALLLLAWPTLHFAFETPQVLAYGLMGAAALALAWGMQALRQPAAAFSAAAGAMGALFLFMLALARNLVDDEPWVAAGLAALLFALGAAQWLVGRTGARKETPGVGIAVAMALLLAWPFLQFEASLWQTFHLAVAAAILCALAGAWPSGRPTMRAAAAASAVVGVASLLLLQGAERAVHAHALGAGLLALLLFALGGLVWGLGRRDPQEPATAAGMAVAAVMLLLWPFMQFRDDLAQTLTLALGGLGLLAGGFAWAPGRRVMHLYAGAAGAVGIASLFSLGGVREAIRQEPLLAGAVTALLAILGAGLWWAGRQGKDPLIRPGGVGIAALSPAVFLGFLLDGWQIAVGWAMEGLVLAVIGIVLRDLEVRIATFAVFALVLGRIFLVDLGNLDLPLRVLTFICTGALLLLTAYLFARQRKATAEPPA